MTGFDQNKENELHPYFEKYDKDGIIKSIYEDGILNGSIEIIRLRSAYCIGWIYFN